MIKLTFLVNEDVFKVLSEDLIKSPFAEISHLKADLAQLVANKIISGDEDFRTINPNYAATDKTTFHTLDFVVKHSLIHKASELIFRRGGLATDEVMTEILKEYNYSPNKQ